MLDGEEEYSNYIEYPEFQPSSSPLSQSTPFAGTETQDTYIDMSGEAGGPQDEYIEVTSGGSAPREDAYMEPVSEKAPLAAASKMKASVGKAPQQPVAKGGGFFKKLFSGKEKQPGRVTAKKMAAVASPPTSPLGGAQKSAMEGYTTLVEQTPQDDYVEMASGPIATSTSMPMAASDDYEAMASAPPVRIAAKTTPAKVQQQTSGGLFKKFFSGDARSAAAKGSQQEEEGQEQRPESDCQLKK